MWNKLLPVIWVHDKLATLEKKSAWNRHSVSTMYWNSLKKNFPCLQKKTPWTMYLGSNSTTDTEILTGHQKYIEA